MLLEFMGRARLIFPKKLAEACPDHTFISFDENFYGHQYVCCRPIDRLWQAIRRRDKFIMDGVPCDTGRAWELFHDYYEKHDCQFVMLKPDIDVWIKRLSASPWFNPLREEWIEGGRPDIREEIRAGDTRTGIRVSWGVDIEKRKGHFNEFYEEWVGGWPKEGVLPDDTIWLDPEELTETLIKRLVHE